MKNRKLSKLELEQQKIAHQNANETLQNMDDAKQWERILKKHGPRSDANAWIRARSRAAASTKVLD